MAKVTITLVDEPNGELKINAEFDPPIGKGPDTPAKVYGMLGLQAIQRAGEQSGGKVLSRKESQATDGFRRPPKGSGRPS